MAMQPCPEEGGQAVRHIRGPRPADRDTRVLEDGGQAARHICELQASGQGQVVRQLARAARCRAPSGQP
eukprot:6365746-Heterocapsa_arctica.AAC.1